MLFVLLFANITYGQYFYVNTGISINPDPNITYRLNIKQCDTLADSLDFTIQTCSPTYQPNPWPDSAYNDIAIDKDQNLWYVTTGGSLYKRNILDSTDTCHYIGDFTDKYLVSGLVADTAGNIYAAGNFNDTSAILRYHPSSGFTTIGTLPRNVYCSGDLFFYEHRLFMTCTNPRQDSSFLYEIVLKDPSQSCYYMPLKNMQPFGAFSFIDNQKTRVYISAIQKPVYATTALVEIDIANRRILDTICIYPFLIRGATAYYEKTGDTTYCPYKPISISDVENKSTYLVVYNPVSKVIRLSSNLVGTDVKSIALFDLAGKMVRSFEHLNFPHNLEILDLNSGLYILQVVDKYGHKWNEKIVKSSYH